MCYFDTYMLLNMENKQKLLCKYFKYPNRKSNDIQRQHNIDIIR